MRQGGWYKNNSPNLSVAPNSRNRVSHEATLGTVSLKTLRNSWIIIIIKTIGSSRGI